MTSAFKDFDIPIAPEYMPAGATLSIDEAIDKVCEQNGWPLLGGPSGKGWSYWSTSQLCPRLFQVTYEGNRDEKRRQETAGGGVPMPLQVGALFHTLTALHYAAEMGEQSIVAPNRGGLCSLEFRGPGRVKLWPSTPDAPEQLLNALKAMCGADEDVEDAIAADGQAVLPDAGGAPAPSLLVVLEAERLFDAHTRHWGKIEDMNPLAVEWFAEDTALGYTCRYDMIARVGDNDPYIPPGLYDVERKSTKWINEEYLEGWVLDGEPLGQIAIWKASGCEKKFGPLTGVVIDVVSKAKVPECRRIVLPADLAAAKTHTRWINYMKGQVALWRATNTYPQYFASCHGRYGRCANWNNCVTATE